MDIEQLKIFLAVYRTKGIAPVADKFGLAPSSVSRSLAGLESKLNTRLFHRTTRKVFPTEAGENFYHQISPLVEELEFSFSALQDTRKAPVGNIRLACSVSFGQLVLTPILKEFQQKYPDINLELILSDRNADLIDDRIDIAIRHGELSDSSLVIRKLMDANYYVVASPEYVLNSPSLQSIEDISEHNVISFPMQELRSEWNFTKGKKQISVPITPKLIISNANAIRECAKNSLGLAILADWTVSADFEKGSLIKVFPEWQAVGSNLGNIIRLVYPSKSFIPKKTQVLSDFLIEKCK